MNTGSENELIIYSLRNISSRCGITLVVVEYDVVVNAFAINTDIITNNFN